MDWADHIRAQELSQCKAHTSRGRCSICRSEPDPGRRHLTSLIEDPAGLIRSATMNGLRGSSNVRQALGARQASSSCGQEHEDQDHQQQRKDEGVVSDIARPRGS